MQLPDDITQTGIALRDKYFDLKGLSLYASMGVSTLRYHINENGLPCYSVRNATGMVTKILVKKSEFDTWMQRKWKEDVGAISDEVIEKLKSDI